MRDISNLAIYLIGATGGIGSATAKLLAKSGAKLAICSIDEEGVKKLSEELKELGAGKVYSDTVDAANDGEVRSFIEQAYTELGAADVLINLAGMSITADVNTFNEDMYEKVMDVNVKSIVLGTKYFVQKTDGQKDALIINFGSMASKRANPAAPHYSAAKAAVNMFSVGYAQQLKNKNIRFTCLNPGPVDTSFYEGRIAPEKRVNFMKPCDVAEVVEFIVSRDTCVVFHDIMFDSFAFFKQ